MNARAISTIVGALIMIASAGLFSSVLLAWSLGFQGQSQTNVASAMFRSNQQAAEVFTIEEVLFDQTANPDVVRIYVRNAGDTPIQIKSVFISNLATGALLCQAELSPGETVTSRAAKPITVVIETCNPARPTIASLMGPPAATVNIRIGSLRGNQVDSNFRVQ